MDGEKTSRGYRTRITRRRLAFVLAGVVLLSSGFHFWPFEGRRAWELFGPVNGAVILWIVVLVTGCLAKGKRRSLRENMPHVSVFAYLCICALSVAFAPDAVRALTVVAKLTLACVGGYSLVSFAASSATRLRALYTLATIAAFLSVGCCLVSRALSADGGWGFFGNPHKYGTYVGMVVPLCGSAMLMNPRTWVKGLGGVLVVAGVASAGTLGGVAAIGSGMLVSMILAARWSWRLSVAASVICSLLIVILLWPADFSASLRRDVAMREKDRLNCRQRYIEWQAFTNVLESRAVTGTGAGCINEYRSEFYYRLPKLNTIEPFDQNGWLSTAAEVGIFGLICFCWAVAHYLVQAWKGSRSGPEAIAPDNRRYAIANCSGLVAACVANTFSSVQYNGILIVFIAVMALTGRVNLLQQGETE